MPINSSNLFRGGLVSPVSSYAAGRQSKEDSQKRQVDIAKGLADLKEREKLTGLSGAYGTDQFIPEAIGASPDVARQVALQQSAAQAKGRFGGSGTFNVQYPLIDVPGQPGTQQYHQFKTDPRTGEPIMTAIPGAFKKTSKLEKIADPDTGRITRFNLITGESFKTNFYDPNVVMGNKKLAAQLARDKVGELQSRMAIAKGQWDLDSKRIGEDEAFDAAMMVADRTLNSLDLMVGNKEKDIPIHKGFKSSVGMKGASLMFGLKDEHFGGSSGADFISKHNQVMGQIFLNAFDAIKGGGQITEMEGTKATQAMSSMSVATSEKEYLKAANILRSEVKRLMGIAKKRRAGFNKSLGKPITPPQVIGIDGGPTTTIPQGTGGINLDGINPEDLQ